MQALKSKAKATFFVSSKLPSCVFKVVDVQQFVVRRFVYGREKPVHSAVAGFLMLMMLLFGLQLRVVSSKRDF